MSIFEEMFKNIQFNSNQTVTGLNHELNAIYLSNLFNKNKHAILVVTNSLFEANKVYQSIKNYTNKVLLFPMDDFLTSEALAISPEFKATRLETLNKLVYDNEYIVITHLMGYLRFLPSSSTWLNSIKKLEKNKDYKMDNLISLLHRLGYSRETIVSKTGEMAIRGFVVDIFPSNYENPIRLEFWGDTLDSIRTFDIDTQLTVKEINSVEITSNTEFITEDSTNNESVHRLLPLVTKVTNITTYLKDPIVAFIDYNQIKASYDMLVEEIANYNLRINVDPKTLYMHDLYVITPPKTINFMNVDNLNIKSKETISYDSSDIDNFVGNTQNINTRLNKYIKDQKTVIICLSNRYKRNHVKDELDNPNIVFTDENNIFNNKINLIIKNINMGFAFEHYIVISEKELFNKKETYGRYDTKFKLGKKIKDITKLVPGDYIVHMKHGIGIYEGIHQLTKNGLKKDYLLLKYKDNDKLYIPVERIELINKYSSNDGIIPKVSKLGGTDWEKTKLKVRNRIENIASELLYLYAIRETKKGFAFPKDTEEQLIFEHQFMHKETSDQLKAIEEIKRDMEKSHPMDRLLCGDVGYGKTEVAFRAIFKAILGGKQVALLCPTTILSKQHYDNALERFKTFPVKIALLNRFVSYNQTRDILQQLKDGKIDILIGTHRLLSDDVEFKDLGLLVIDEEQRFGVKHKEKIKQYKNAVDVLTLSATPIPRTLQMSMVGLRNLSLIETPPVNRYPIQTYVLAENKQIIKDAIYKELSRHGQVFFLYNNIDNIELKVHEITMLVPDAKITFAHGRMEKNELEKRMMAFINKEYDILVCTTIIETGIDIPNVNTLIIIDADNYGLSQLYQIRGRVGRSNKIAYAYLMYNQHKQLNDIAIKRLKAIKDFTELGSGFSIAMRDLSIRGAGDILGSEQAGFIDSVGIELFLKMLNEEIAKIKGEFTIEDEEQKKPNPLIEVETTIEDNYVKEEELKIQIHRKINTIKSYEDIIKVKEELEDRFGKISENMLIYMYEELFEKLANKLRITNVKQTKNSIEIVLNEEITSKINGELLFTHASQITRMFRFALNNNCLTIILDIVKLEKHFIYYLVSLLDVLDKKIIKKS